LTGSGQGPVAGYCECGDEPSGSCATELVTYAERRGSELEKCYSRKILADRDIF
jgi:hypothetical protein